MNFAPTTWEDIPAIRELFGSAIEFQKIKFGKHWHGLNEEQLAAEVGKQLHWKIMEGADIAAFFSIAFTDALVWDERDADRALYLQRIVTNPKFRGRGYVRAITGWAEEYGRKAGVVFIRLDTDRDNTRLNDYYQECGYMFCGNKIFHDRSNPDIPGHYFGSGLSLYQRPIHGPNTWLLNGGVVGI